MAKKKSLLGGPSSWKYLLYKERKKKESKKECLPFECSEWSPKVSTKQNRVSDTISCPKPKSANLGWINQLWITIDW